MSDLKICRICLRTEAKGYKFECFQLKYFYEEVIALKVNDNDGLPQWFCFECAAFLHKFHKFKEKCYIGQKALKELLWKGPITYEAIYKIDRTMIQLKSSLETISVNKRVKTFTAKYIEHSNLKTDNGISNELCNEEPMKNLTGDEPMNNLNNLTGEDPMKNLKNVTGDNIIKLDTRVIQEDCRMDHSLDDEINNIENNSFIIGDYHSPVAIIVEENNIINLQSKNIINKRKDLEMSIKEFGNKYLSDDNWKKISLTEEEALKEFRAKAEDPKYLDAAYKCGDCFKGFSKKHMLNRHLQSRHSEDLGRHECRFCRMRFKWNCHLRKHTQQHYTKYECLRCHIVFHLDTSALLHEEYHSGTTKKCLHCDEQFRHMTTYYTHLRTHRSAHVCVLCGASFVSSAGLHQHRRRKHPYNELDGQTSEEDIGTVVAESYCSCCDIRFETRKAFEEHLFHSAMHTEVVKTEEDIAPAKKILGKRLRAKITKELRERKSDLDISVPVRGKRRKKLKRKPKKPSTCHQCGRHFETQAACMKHHLAEHPRTSFYPPNQRHICELCGASLAPGSVAVHQNMHSRERLHTCETCGKQFHSGVGLKRHLVTHTGEKPFGCPLCDKRFTQSNSMKLHYRTFHLKQPYPKRTRKKKKDQPNQSTEQEDSYEEESDSLPEPEVAEHVTAPGDVTAHIDNMPDENLHYLTLG